MSLLSSLFSASCVRNSSICHIKPLSPLPLRFFFDLSPTEALDDGGDRDVRLPSSLPLLPSLPLFLLPLSLPPSSPLPLAADDDDLGERARRCCPLADCSFIMSLSMRASKTNAGLCVPERLLPALRVALGLTACAGSWIGSGSRFLRVPT